MTQVIDKGTRTTSTSAALLVLIITNKPDVILSHGVVPLVIADLDLVSVVINVHKPRKLTVVKTLGDLKNYDKDTFCSLLNYIPFMNNIFSTGDIDKQMCTFSDTFTKCLEMFAPTVTKAVKGRSASWMSDEIREAMQDRNERQNNLK